MPAAGAPRKPLVSLWVLLPLLIAGGTAAALGTVALFARSRGIAMREVADGPALLLSIGGLLLWIPPGLMLGNAIMAATPALRRIAEDHARRRAAPDFGTAQRDLARFAIGTAGLVLPVVAAVFAFAD